MVEKPDVRAVTSELVKRINEDTRRIRILEQRMDRIENSLSGLEETVLTQMGDLKLSLERISNKIGTVADRLSSIENDILRVNKELGRAATKAEVKQLETFIDLVNPITSRFVTKDELERVLLERLGKKA